MLRVGFLRVLLVYMSLTLAHTVYGQATGANPSRVVTSQEDAVRRASELLRQNKPDAAISLLLPPQATRAAVPGAAHQLGLAYCNQAQYALAVSPPRSGPEAAAHD